MNLIQNVETKSDYHIMSSIVLAGIILGIAIMLGGGHVSYRLSNLHSEKNDGKNLRLAYDPPIPISYHVYVSDNSIIPESTKPYPR
jgi:hypothetical protein